MFKQVLVLLPLYFIFCAAAPSPNIDTRDTAVTCALPAHIWCCSKLSFVYNSYVGTGCEPFSSCATPVCCTGTFYSSGATVGGCEYA
ncbi:hypothetical protein EV421DRAFT_1830982 [Armillaria borealis]|uniref:Hydrophobin n=1 Tax=Armillaria borealis TaxID=47425 RepID=A0AA39J5H5_9AGAR|nr:hypothetical protein EV421DRAFT_1830982 [Armillaria borealis]